jgi:hypothetical protein
MRHRIRIQPYISRALHRKLRAHSAANNLTDSAVAEEALSKYLESDAIEDALVLRRLAGVDGAVARLQHDIDVLSQTVATLARYTLAATTVEVTPASGRRAHQLFTQILAQAAKEIDGGVRLAGLLDRARGELAATRSSDTGGGR